MYSPMNEHTLEFWKMRNEENVLFNFYEDMKRNLPEIVEKTMKFLGRNYSRDQIEKLCQHLSFESMRNNGMVNKDIHVKHAMEISGKAYDPSAFSFIRKGEVGAHKKELSAEENEKLDEYVNSPELKQHGFAYK
jgi:UDP-galactopyranose mutase